MNTLLRLLARGQRIDRRVLYLLLALVIGVPIVLRIPVPPSSVSPQTQRFYETIEEIAKDPVRRQKLIIVSTDYGSGTLAENQPQTEAVVRHLMRHKLKFAIFAFASAQGREMGRMAYEKAAPRYGYEYGRDYVNFGYRPPDAVEALLKAAVRDVPGAWGTDINSTPLSEVPVMKGIKTVDDIGAIIEIASASTLTPWLQYFQRTGREPVATLFCPTSVMAPEAYPYLKSGQLQGMLTGLKGAIEYESLLGEAGFATQLSPALSYSHLLIIILIILGNLGMFAERKLRSQATGRAEEE